MLDDCLRAFDLFFIGIYVANPFPLYCILLLWVYYLFSHSLAEFIGITNTTGFGYIGYYALCGKAERDCIKHITKRMKAVVLVLHTAVHYSRRADCFYFCCVASEIHGLR
jgi:hypothetical protein